MIYGKLSELAQYRGISKFLDKSFDFLRSADLSGLPLGKTEIEGEDVYCNHFTYTTAGLSPDSLFEAHIRYLDLHIVLSGRERVGITPIEALDEAEARISEDSILYHGTPKNTLVLEEGQFLLLFPGEGHLPKLTAETPSNIDKLVFKITCQDRED